MDARLQRRVQRYGWDLAADRYEASWAKALAPAQMALLQLAGIREGERVLEVACGTGLVAFAAATRNGATGDVLGVDLSQRMVDRARNRAAEAGHRRVRFERMDAEALVLDDASFDVVLCALGLMYVPDAERAIAEMHRVLRPGGRIVLAVWGERHRCGWAPLFPIVDAEVESEVCPLFFRLGTGDTLALVCQAVGFADVRSTRLDRPFKHDDAEAACEAAFAAGPAALAWQRFDPATRQRVREAYLKAIEPHRSDVRYWIPGEFVLVSAKR